MAETLAPQPRIKPIIWVLGGVLALALGLGVWQLPLLLPLVLSVLPTPPSLTLSSEPSAPEPVEKLPAVFERKPEVYGTPPPVKERPPVAQPVFTAPAPAVPKEPTPAMASARPASHAQAE